MSEMKPSACCSSRSMRTGGHDGSRNTFEEAVHGGPRLALVGVLTGSDISLHGWVPT
jgi:hypothetical protein